MTTLIIKRISLISFLCWMASVVLTFTATSASATGKHFLDEQSSSQKNSASSQSAIKNPSTGSTKNITRIVTTPLEKSAESHEIY
ncbi:MAG: hypothetical protein EOO68_28430, partial [Moraxellaceae bacterium]